VRISWSACSTINYLRPRVYFEGALETIENTSSSAFFPGTARFSFCRLCRVPPLVNCASLSRFLFIFLLQTGNNHFLLCNSIHQLFNQKKRQLSNRDEIQPNKTRRRYTQAKNESDCWSTNDQQRRERVLAL
jgi:hypothetical protein